mmetsp:Transcript_42440/g.68206  ORF Transcript_42440/g.68206 Transcript_42440/m.68206 type:complete len:265 (+) Transcript_42440:59-853(+)
MTQVKVATLKHSLTRTARLVTKHNISRQRACARHKCQSRKQYLHILPRVHVVDALNYKWGPSDQSVPGNSLHHATCATSQPSVIRLIPHDVRHFHGNGVRQLWAEPGQHQPQLLGLVHERPQRCPPARVPQPFAVGHASGQGGGAILSELPLQRRLHFGQPLGVVLQPPHSAHGPLQQRGALAQQVELGADVKVPALHEQAVFGGDRGEVVQRDLLVVVHMQLERLALDVEVDGDIASRQPRAHLGAVTRAGLLLVFVPPRLKC